MLNLMYAHAVSSVEYVELHAISGDRCRLLLLIKSQVSRCDVTLHLVQFVVVFILVAVLV